VVPLELTELAGGLPMAASFAMAGGISVLREGRRRTALNRAVPELRRPLQAIALASPASPERAGAFESALWMAAAAVDRLDREINGGAAEARCGIVHLRPLVEAAASRWEPLASLDQRAVTLEFEGDDPGFLGDRIEIAQAVDNLISNAVVHGAGEIAVKVRAVDTVVRVVVLNRRREEGSQRATRRLRRLSGRARHGHGLRIVRTAASRAGGSFRLRVCDDVCEARLELALGEVAG
jgi:signal transduction histidine kinase